MTRSSRTTNTRGPREKSHHHGESRVLARHVVSEALKDITGVVEEMVTKEKARGEEIQGMVMELGKEMTYMNLEHARQQGAGRQQCRLTRDLARGTIPNLCEGIATSSGRLESLEDALCVVNMEKMNKTKRIRELEIEAGHLGRDVTLLVQQNETLRDMVREAEVVLGQKVDDIRENRNETYTSLASSIAMQRRLNRVGMRLDEEMEQGVHVRNALTAMRYMVVEPTPLWYQWVCSYSSINITREENEMQSYIHQVLQSLLLHATTSCNTRRLHTGGMEKKHILSQIFDHIQDVMNREQTLYDEKRASYQAACTRVHEHREQLSQISERLQNMTGECESIERACHAITRDIQHMESFHTILFKPPAAGHASTSVKKQTSRQKKLEDDIRLLEGELEHELARIFSKDDSR